MEPPAGAPPTPPETPPSPASTPPPPASPEPQDPGISQLPPKTADETGPLPPPFGPVVVGDGGIAPPPSAQVFTPTDPNTGSSSGFRLPKKRLLIPAVAIPVVLIAAAIFYFGYYMNPSVVYAQALSNTGKGYDKLVDYADSQAELYGKGTVGSGTYKVNTASSSTDGKFSFKGNRQDGEVNFDVGVGATRIDTDIRAIRSTGTSPDIYVKVGGLKGLGTVLGDPSMDAGMAKLDGTWILIDHTLIDNLGSASGGGSSSGRPTSPTRVQMIDEARAFGQVNRQYVFTTAKSRAVTKIVKRYGTETIDGRKTYHYQVALRKDNVRSYILAQKDALRASKLNGWLKANKYDTSVYKGFDEAAKSANDIKETDTFDVWADMHQRVIYKVRITSKQNPASNYVDIGLNYKGGSDYPFFIEGKSKDSGQTATYSFLTDLDTKTGKTGFKAAYQADGSDGGKLDMDFSFGPSTSAVKVAKPAKTISLSQALSYLGYEGVLDGAGAGQGSGSAGGAAIPVDNRLSGMPAGMPGGVPAPQGTSADASTGLAVLFSRLLGR